MFFSQQLIDDKIAQLRQLQNDEGFLARKAKADAEKKEAVRLANNKKAVDARKAKQAALAEGMPPADPKKQAKEIIKARKLKAIKEQLRDDRKSLPARIGGPDLTGKIPVKLDDRTTVYARPGYDLQDLKRKFLVRDKDIMPIGDKSADKAHKKQQHQYPGEIYNLAHLVKIGGR